MPPLSLERFSFKIFDLFALFFLFNPSYFIPYLLLLEQVLEQVFAFPKIILPQIGQDFSFVLLNFPVQEVLQKN